MDRIDPLQVEVVLYNQGFELRALFTARTDIGRLVSQSVGEYKASWVVHRGKASSHQNAEVFHPPCVIDEGKLVADVPILTRSTTLKSQGVLLPKDDDVYKPVTFASGVTHSRAWQAQATSVQLVSLVLASHGFPVKPEISGHFTDVLLSTLQVSECSLPL